MRKTALLLTVLVALTAPAALAGSGCCKAKDAGCPKTECTKNEECKSEKKEQCGTESKGECQKGEGQKQCPKAETE